MTDLARRPARKKPLIASTIALRALATALTLTSFGGMTIFASENLYVSNAPLQPAAVAAVAPVATTTPAPTSAPTTATTSRTRVRSSVTTTTTTPVTRTKQS